MNSDPKRPENSQPDESSRDVQMEKFKDLVTSYAEATNADDQEKADQAALSLLMMATEEAMAHPTPALELAGKASEHLMAGEWQGAEEIYRKLITMQEQTGKPGTVTKPQMDLSNLFYLLNRLDDAWFWAQAATDSARRSDLAPLMAMALRNQVTCARARGDTQAALAAAENALGAVDPGKMGDLMRSVALAGRGRVLLDLGEIAKAEKDLQAAWSILRSKKQSRIGSGPVAAFASCFELEAELHAHHKRFFEAISALQQAIGYRRMVIERLMEQTPHPIAAVARDLERLAELQVQNVDTAAAEESLKEAAALWEQLHLPERAKRRGSPR